MQLPFKGAHINLWLLRDTVDKKSCWTLVDTGLFNKENKLIWKSIIEKHFDGLKLLRVICTHMHSDHIGLASWLCKGLDDDRWNFELWMSYGEFFNGRAYSLERNLSSTLNSDSKSFSSTSYFYSHGCNLEKEKNKIDERSSYYYSIVSEFPVLFRKLLDNQELRIGKLDWVIVTGSGHFPEHISLYNMRKNLLISGNMILTNITSHVGVFPDEPTGNPLGAFLKSLDKSALLPMYTRMVPSHGKPFKRIKDRIKQLENHYKKRMEKILFNCSNEKTAYQLIPNIFSRKLDNHQFFFVLCEIIAHLNYGWHTKLLSRFKQEGIIKFKTII